MLRTAAAAASSAALVRLGYALLTDGAALEKDEQMWHSKWRAGSLNELLESLFKFAKLPNVPYPLERVRAHTHAECIF